MDFILNGQAQGNVATTLLQNGFNVSALRPWVGKDGRSYISHNQDGKVVAVPALVSNATLRKDEWEILDEAIISAAQKRLTVVGGLRGAGLTYNIPNGMGKTILETETVGDITEATVSMDPIRESEYDRPEYDLVSLPLPVIHKDFYFSARQIATSRNSGASIDVTTAQLASRRVAEEAEKLVLGTGGAFSYGGGSIYGLTNFPSRITKVLTAPTTSNQATIMREVLAMRQASIDNNYFGPWVLYVSSAYGLFLDDDYSATKGDNTLRERIKMIDGISDIRTADYLGTGYHMILVQQTTDVIRMVMGMDITTVQWETNGGMRINFKVMAIMVPQLRADFNGHTGIVHGSV
jgi:uncharacterized linocin/CFP29 family protein